MIRGVVVRIVVMVRGPNDTIVIGLRQGVMTLVMWLGSLFTLGLSVLLRLPTLTRIGIWFVILFSMVVSAGTFLLDFVSRSVLVLVIDRVDMMLLSLARCRSLQLRNISGALLLVGRRLSLTLRFVLTVVWNVVTAPLGVFGLRSL